MISTPYRQTATLLIEEAIAAGARRAAFSRVPMTDYPDEDQRNLNMIKVHSDRLERVLNRSGPEVVKAMNNSLRFMEDYFLGGGSVADVPYVPRNKQGNQRYTAISSDPVVTVALRRKALGAARFESLHVPSLTEEQQFSEDCNFLAHKNIALAKALGSPPIPRFPPPKLTRSISLALLAEPATKAAMGRVDPSRIKVEARPGSLKKLRSFLIRFATESDLLVLVAIEFDGLALWSAAVGLTHPEKLPLPLLTFMDVSPASDFAWPADMPTETRIACFLKVIAIFAAQIR